MPPEITQAVRQSPARYLHPLITIPLTVITLPPRQVHMPTPGLMQGLPLMTVAGVAASTRGADMDTDMS
jgi:hypothetical protein